VKAIGLLLLVPLLVGATPGEAPYSLDEVYRAVDVQDWSRATHLLEEHLAAEPGDKPGTLLLARIHSWAQQYAASRRWYLRYRELEPRDPVAARELAMVLYWDNDCNAAGPLLEQVLVRDPENAEVLEASTACTLGRGDLAGAQARVELLETMGVRASEAARMAKEVQQARRPEWRSEALYRRDSAGYQAIELGSGLGFFVADELKLTPRVGYGAYSLPDRLAHGVRGRLGLEWLPPGVLSYGLGGGFEQYWQPAQEGRPAMHYGGPTADGNLRARWDNGVTLELHGLYQQAARALQTVATSKDPHQEVRAGLAAGWAVSPRVELSLGGDYHFYFQDGGPDVSRWSAYGDVVVDVVRTRWLFAGAVAYTTGFDRHDAPFWCPAYYVGVQGLVGSRFLRWGQGEEGLTARALAGAATESPTGASSAWGPALGGQLDLVLLDRANTSLEAQAGYSRTVRQAISYWTTWATLAFAYRF
jgi:hypothetical protein